MTTADKPSPLLRRSLWLPVSLLALASLAGAAGWYGWRQYVASEPPEVDLSEADPALAEAIEAARAQVRREPYSAAAWGRLGKILRGSIYYEPAAACFAQASKLEPAEPRWPYLRGESLEARDPAAAREHLSQAIAIWDQHGGAPVVPRLRWAEMLLQEGRLDEVEAQLARALELEPDNPNLWLLGGQLAAARDDSETCRDCLLGCQQSPYTRQRAAAQLAAVCGRLGDPNAAAEFQRRAASLPPDAEWIDPLVQECRLLVVGRTDRLRQVEALESRKRYREAVELLREMAAEGADVRVLIHLGRDLAQLNDRKGAEGALRRAVEREPDNVQANYLLAKLLWACDDHAGAAAAARRALAAKPDYGLAHLILGLSLGHLGEKTESLAELRKAADCSPDNPDAWLHLAERLTADGQPAEARKCLERARDVAAPDDPRPREALEKLPKGEPDRRGR